MPKDFDLPDSPAPRLGKAFWRFAKAAMRHGDDDAERSDKVLKYLISELPQLKRLCNNDQADILGQILDQYQRGKIAPSWPVIREWMSTDHHVASRIEEYEGICEELPTLEAMDMPALVSKLRGNWTIRQAGAALELACEVNRGLVKVEGRHGNMVPLVGPEAALNLVAEVRDEIYRGGQSASSTVIMGDSKSESIIREETLGLNQRKVIPTGFPGLDEVLTLSPCQLVGILAGPAEGKTRLTRSISYNMARSGFKVLHVQLETHETSEVNYYSLIHAFSNPEWAARARYLGLTFNQLNRGEASPESTSWLTGVVLKDFRDCMNGSVTILSPKDNRWESIRDGIEAMTGGEDPFDAVFIDYLTLVESGSTRDKDGRVLEAISNATRWATASSTLVITPIQGRRDAVVKAKEEGDGLWDLSGIYKYSDYDRHLTACISLTSMDTGEVHLGLPKNRWGPPLWSPIVCEVDHACGYISQRRMRSKDFDKTFDDVFLDIDL